MKSTTTSTVSTTFTFNGTVYTANGTKNHCYRWPEGLKGERVRINKAEFEAAEDQYNAECKARIEKAADDMIAYREAAEKAIAEQDAQQELEDELLKAAEDPTVSVEEFVDMITTPKAKKTHKSKDVAYSGHGVTLTAKQADFIQHLSDTYFWEDGVESVIWIDCLCDDIKGQFANKPMTVGAMISTLCEKDLGLRTTCRRENRKCVSFELTELGQLVAKELGLN